MVAAAETTADPYLLPCRHCGDPVAVRTSSGRLRSLGEFTVSRDGRIVIVCPTCQRDTRVTGRLIVTPKRT